MATVLLYSITLENEKINPWMRSAYDLFAESAASDPFKRHTLTSDAESADLIIFIEVGIQGQFAERVRRHPFLKRYREKCFLFDSGDYAVPLLPGLYASLRNAYYDPGRTRTGYYLPEPNPLIHLRSITEATHLATFVGSLISHPVRRLFRDLPSPEFLIEDTSAVSLNMLTNGSSEDKTHFLKHYADSLAQGLFALCPRGLGPGSVRLFEAMRTGRCPVILSDDWAPPQRISWNTCSLTVAEKDVARLPEILTAHRDRAAELGNEARLQWETYYEPSVRFHWLVEDCLDILKARRRSESLASKLAWRHVLLSCEQMRHYIRSKKTIFTEEKRLLF